jgi:hypothetical protein
MRPAARATEFQGKLAREMMTAESPAVSIMLVWQSRPGTPQGGGMSGMDF